MQIRLSHTLMSVTLFWSLAITPCFAVGEKFVPGQLVNPKETKLVYKVVTSDDKGLTARLIDVDNVPPESFNGQAEVTTIEDNDAFMVEAGDLDTATLQAVALTRAGDANGFRPLVTTEAAGQTTPLPGAAPDSPPARAGCCGVRPVRGLGLPAFLRRRAAAAAAPAEAAAVAADASATSTNIVNSNN